ncbi:MAG: glucose-6-phosphate dehydrogenase assembly protein OpcA [Polyangiaceae bacterium]
MSDEAPQSLPGDRFTRGADIGVDVTMIERELASLWRQASSDDRAVTRACSWNLLIHVAEGEDVDAARALVDKVVMPVPSRAIVLVPRPNDAGKEVEAFVSANCQVAPGGKGKLLCSEEITILTRGVGDRLVPSLVRALLVPDVPTALLWIGPPPADPRQIPYFECVDRLIFDSAKWIGPSAAMERTYAGIRAESRASVSLVDLAWLRAGFLRSMLATMFDPPTGSGPLERVTELVVSGATGGNSTARIFAAWFASRLGWSTGRIPDRGTKAKTKSGGEVSIVVDGEARATPSGLANVVVRTTDAGGAPIEFSIQDVGDGTLNVHVHGQTDRPKIAADLAIERLVIAALGARGRDPVYRDALALAAGAEG